MHMQANELHDINSGVPDHAFLVPIMTLCSYVCVMSTTITAAQLVQEGIGDVTCK